MCIFSHLSNTVYEWVEWMWRMSKRSGVDVENERANVCGQYLKRIFICVWQKNKLLCVFYLCIDIM